MPPFPKAGAKVRTFSDTTKYFGSFFVILHSFSSPLDEYQDTERPYTLLYICARGACALTLINNLGNRTGIIMELFGFLRFFL
jgi:hypothetical protein